MRHQNILMMQSLGIFVTADTLLLAYGFAQRRSGILFLASLMPLGMLFVYNELMASVAPISHVATKLEQILSLHEAPLITTFIYARHGRILSSLLSNMEGSYDSTTHRFAKRVPVRLLLKERISRALLLAFVAQLCLFIVSLTLSQYRFM